MQDVSLKEGRTVLFVSHQIAAITRLCKQALWLDGGKAKDYGLASLICSGYLANGSSTSARRDWTSVERAPGNGWVRLTKVEAITQGTVADQIGIDQPVEINLEYEVLRGGKVLIPNIHLFAEDGTLIFISHDWHSGWRARPKSMGKYQTTFHIPGNFFSEGRITVRVAISTYLPLEVHFDEADVIAFNVVEAGSENTARGDYSGHLPGIIRPLITTRTDIVP